MIRIGIYSGTFDPITLGHLWVIKEGIRLFEEFRVVVGHHPNKKCMFSVEERLDMIRGALSEHEIDKCVKLDVLPDNQGIITYVRQDASRHCKKMDSVYCLLRGIRNARDYGYEHVIDQEIRERTQSALPTIFVTPPDKVAGLSSTAAKQAAELGLRADLLNIVPFHVMEKLMGRYSIDTMSTSGHCVKMDDLYVATMKDIVEKKVSPDRHIEFPLDVKFKRDKNLEKMHQFFEHISEIGFINLSKEVTGDQVREILEDVGIDLVVSDRFYLKEVDVEEVSAIGERYVSCSRSLGPVIVEANHIIGDNTAYGKLGPVIVIEGKHRLLDAIEHGKKRIQAWVGEKAIVESLKALNHWEDEDGIV